MKQQYESEILNKLMERDGFNIPSSVPPYEAEIKAYLINQVKQAYPKLTDYEAEWLLYNYTKHLPADFPIESVSNVTTASFENVVPYAYQSAILSGQTLVNLIRIVGKKNLEQYQDVVSLIHVKPSTKYLLKIKNNTSEAKSFYSSEITEWTQIDIEANQTITKTLTTKSTLGRNTLLQNAKTHTTEHDLSIIFIEYQDGMENWDIPYFEGMQSVQMPVLTTSNEDGTKTNILTVNEEVELRGIGDVQDTLDCLTGEVIERIGEVVLDGSEKWEFNTTVEDGGYNVLSTYFSCSNCIQDITIEGFTAVPVLVCDKFIGGSREQVQRLFDEGICQHDNGVGIRILDSKLSTVNVNSFKQWLSQNPITVQYKLATPVVKTVDLTTVNEKGESTYFMPIEGTMHITTFGQPINPLMDISVPVEATTQNLASFIDMEME